MPRQSNQPKRSKKNRQARATLKPSSVSTPPEANVVSTSAGTAARAVRGQALPYGGKAVIATGERVRSTQAVAISREQEYGFIRADLRRLIYTAGILLVVMFALLFLVDR